MQSVSWGLECVNTTECATGLSLKLQIWYGWSLKEQKAQYQPGQVHFIYSLGSQKYGGGGYYVSLQLIWEKKRKKKTLLFVEKYVTRHFSHFKQALLCCEQFSDNISCLNCSPQQCSCCGKSSLWKQDLLVEDCQECVPDFCIWSVDWTLQRPYHVLNNWLYTHLILWELQSMWNLSAKIINMMQMEVQWLIYCINASCLLQ